MSNPYYKLPEDLAGDIAAYELDVRRFMDGSLPSAILKARRVPRGVYEQRQDGAYMVRVRVAGGALTSGQTRELASLAAEFGNGLLHVTTRQDIQIHDVAIEHTPFIMRRLLAAGLTSKGGGGNTVRNVTACPYSGVCPNEAFDVAPFAYAVTENLISLIGSYNLPRKYKIAFSGCAADCALAQVSDLGFIAASKNGRPGFRVLAGGGMGAQSRIADELSEWTPVSQTIRFAEAVRRLFDKEGDRRNKHQARLRYVFERLGLKACSELFDKMLEEATRDGTPEWQGECAPVKPGTGFAPVAPVPEPVSGVRVLRQSQAGFVSVPLRLPLGFVSSSDFGKIGELADQFSGENGLRTTRSQDLIIRFVPEGNLTGFARALGVLSFDPLSDSALDVFVACAGASTCRLGLCMARDAARNCAEALEAASIPPDVIRNMQFNINGCPNACGQQPVGAIGLVGAAQRMENRLVPCYRVTLGGRCDAKGARLGNPAGQVPARALPSFAVALADDFSKGRRDGESFLAYYERAGHERFERIVLSHADVPSYSDNPSFYRDLGCEGDFSLAGRGAGECGAGVFEVIQEDLIAARKASEPFDILVLAARALLITRGVDTREADAVFREFENQFIDTGLVAEEFRGLLSRARGYVQGWKQALDGCEGDIARLLERVDLLYSTLDGNLEFHPPESKEARPSGDVAHPPSLERESNSETGGQLETELDLRGVACPMNFVKAKLKLESMDTGRSLAIILDDGEPVRNVPASFRGEGQSVGEPTRLDDGHWRVVVRKNH